MGEVKEADGRGAVGLRNYGIIFIIVVLAMASWALVMDLL